ncbi:endonuclease III [Candidatus Gottesmanbacteria bacterium]|nr:endonuclease III [Candidatus Gottesmanbacteria bacterium]
MTYDARGETFDDRKKRALEIIAILKKTYPSAKIVLKYKTPWELLVATILSAQCTDKVVNQVSEKLFAKYPTIDDYCKVELREFEEDIKSTGFFRNKAKAILQNAITLKKYYGGHLPRQVSKMTNLSGVGRKTANIVLSNAFGIIEGIAVDTHVHRISQRLRLVDFTAIKGKKDMLFTRNGQEVLDYKRDADPDKIEKELIRLLPKKEWYKFTYLLIDHGRAICKAQNPDCPNCPLKHLCPASRV